MSPAHALRVAGLAAGHHDERIARDIEAFYRQLRAADEDTAKAMIDNPTGWKP